MPEINWYSVRVIAQVEMKVWIPAKDAPSALERIQEHSFPSSETPKIIEIQEILSITNYPEPKGD